MKRKTLFLAVAILAILALATAGFATYASTSRSSAGTQMVSFGMSTTGTHVVQVNAPAAGHARAWVDNPPFDEAIAATEAYNGACDRNTFTSAIIDPSLGLVLNVVSYTSGKAWAYCVNSSNLGSIPDCREID